MWRIVDIYKLFCYNIYKKFRFKVEYMDIFNSWLATSPIAHRGLFDKVHPENSLSAYDEAIKAGYPIAIDVCMLSDGTIVVFSDECLSRLTGNDGYLKFLKKSDLDILRLCGTKEKVPTLKEALDFVDGRVPLFVEIQNDSKVGDLEKGIIDFLKEYKGKVAIASKNPYVLEYFYNYAPEILRGQISGFYKNEKIPHSKKSALKKLKFNNDVSHPNFICYESEHLPNRFVRKYKDLPLIAYSLKNQIDYLKVVKYCDNVIFENFEPMI